METSRPRVRLERTGFDALLDGLAIFVWLSGLAIVLIVWPDLPERLPMHFDMSGRPNRWGPRGELFVLPTLSLLLLVGLAVLSRFPHTYNYVVVITEDNARRQYRLAVRLLQTLNIVLQALFSVIVFTVIRVAQGLPHPGLWLVSALMAVTMILLIVYLVKSSSEPLPRRSS